MPYVSNRPVFAIFPQHVQAQIPDNTKDCTLSLAGLEFIGPKTFLKSMRCSLKGSLALLRGLVLLVIAVRDLHQLAQVGASLLLGLLKRPGPVFPRNSSPFCALHWEPEDSLRTSNHHIVHFKYIRILTNIP